MQKNHALLFMTFLVFLTGVVHVNAQKESTPSVTSTYFIPNVHITVKPGMTLENVSLVIQDGTIKEIGQGIQAPFNSEIIKADSLHVYSAFIDALSHTGVPKKEEQEKKEKIIPGRATNQQAGITPEKTLREVLDEKDKSIGAMRKNGFAISHSVPRGRMIPGKGSIISLSGKGKESIVLKENTSMFSQFSAARRIYPATIIGMMAKWRDLYRQSSYAIKHEKSYKNNPASTKRPAYNDATRALFDVVEKKQAVFFNTEGFLTATRALALQKDLGFNIVLTELKQGQKLIPKIKQQAIPVLLSLDLPKKDKDEKKKDKKDEDQKDEKDKKELSEFEKEKQQLENRKAEATKEYIGQAAAFESNNIPFSFSFMESKPKDLFTNINRMREAGLSDDAALAALTTNPAKLLGIDNVAGTLERGKLANIVIMTKPIFDEKAKIKFMFVEGNKFEYDVKEKKKKAKKDGDTSAVELAGTWTYEIEIPGMTPTGKLIIVKQDEDYQITMTSDQDEDDEPEIIDNAEIEGNNMAFTFEVDNGGFMMTVDLDVEIDGDSFEGTVSVGDFGSFPITGDRIEKPKND